MSRTRDNSNGVKEGGVLSQILYSVYVDNLFRILIYSKIAWMYIIIGICGQIQPE